MTPDEIRSAMKEAGVVPHRPWNQRPIMVLSTNEVFDPYIPDEGDGKISEVQPGVGGIKSRNMNVTQKFGQKQLGVRRIRSFHEDFDLADFAAQDAFDIYVKAHTILAEGENLDRLHEFVTERAYADMIHNANLKTIRWKYVRAIDPPRAVHVRVQQIMEKSNYYAQITVRFHSQQMLAIYDRFGRLMYGSEAVLKDVLEYCVFEQHLNYQYGSWRLHGKIIPDWMPAKDPIKKTFRKPVFTAESEEEKAEAERKRAEADKEDDELPLDEKVLKQPQVASDGILARMRRGLGMKV
jgi:large subunit ribosomal protein L45